MYARVRFSSTLLFRPFSDKIKILPQYAVLLLLSHIGRQHATVSAGRSTNSLKNSRVTLELSSPPLEVFHRVLSLFLSPLLSLSLSLSNSISDSLTKLSLSISRVRSVDFTGRLFHFFFRMIPLQAMEIHLFCPSERWGQMFSSH